MKPQSTQNQAVDTYIRSYPKKTQHMLKSIRQAIRSMAPGSVESISYGVPTTKLNGRPLAYFAGFTNHVSMYPVSDGLIAAVPGLAKHRTGKGTVQFSLSSPLPLGLVKKFVAYKLRENKARFAPTPKPVSKKTILKKATKKRM